MASSEQQMMPRRQISRKEIPVLCYHQIRNWQSSDSKGSRVFILPEIEFKAQIQMLYDSGYHVISPDKLIAYLKNDVKLPPKPIMLTFDDGTVSQYEKALPVLDKYNFKGVFFIMSVTLNKPAYMTEKQLKYLAEKGHVIGCHTWDHNNVVTYKNTDWVRQIKRPKHTLEVITGQPVNYFAYPNGTWNNEAVDTLEKYGFRAAFQLYGKHDEQAPLYTIRRILVSGYWQKEDVLMAIRKIERK